MIRHCLLATFLAIPSVVTAADRLAVPGLVEYLQHQVNGNAAEARRVGAERAMHACAVLGGSSCTGMDGGKIAFYTTVMAGLDGQVNRLSMNARTSDDAERLANTQENRQRVDARIEEYRQAQHYLMDGMLTFSMFKLLDDEASYWNGAYTLPVDHVAGIEYTNSRVGSLSLNIAMPTDKARAIRAFNQSMPTNRILPLVYLKVVPGNRYSKYRYLEPFYAEWSTMDAKGNRVVVFTAGAPGIETPLRDVALAEFTDEGIAFLQQRDKHVTSTKRLDMLPGGQAGTKSDVPGGATAPAVATAGDGPSVQVEVKLGDVVDGAGKALGGLLNGLFSGGK